METVIRRGVDSQPMPMTTTLTVEAFLDEVDRHNQILAESFGNRHTSWRTLAAHRESERIAADYTREREGAA